MQTVHVSSLLSVDVVVLGGTVGGLACALRKADAGCRVLLVEQGTCLYQEMSRTGDYRYVLGGMEPWDERLFPRACMASPGLAHPDRLKLHGEALCEQAGIQLLYATQALSWNGQALLLAHKAGLFTVAAKRLFDLREHKQPVPPTRFFSLHVTGVQAQLPYTIRMEETLAEVDLRIPASEPLLLHAGPAGDGHAVLSIPVVGTVDEQSPAGRHALYELALMAFRSLKEQPGCEGSILARSGSCCSASQGLDVAAEVRWGLSAGEGWLAEGAALGEMLSERIHHDNPLYPGREPATFPVAVSSHWSGDVLVVGGGTAGAIAAYSTAKQGMRVRLLEMNGMLGGTATCGGVSIYWFGTRDGATAMVDARVDALYRSLGLPRGRCLWNEHDVFLPDLKAHAVLSLCLEAGVDIVFGATCCAVEREGSRVTGAVYAQGGRLCVATAAMVIDATGDADLAMFAGARHTYGGQENALTYWGSLAQYTLPGSYRNNFSTMAHVGSPLDYTRFILAGRRRGGALYDHGGYLALRESRHIQGVATVTLSGLLSGEDTGDTLYQCFSNYDPKGKLTSDLVYAGLLPPNLRMNVPRGAVIPTAMDGTPIEGLLVGGKAVSVTHDAFPGLRMQPDLQQQGFALGILAAEAVRQGVPAWQAKGVSETIRAQGGQAILPIYAGEKYTLQDAVSALTGKETLEWLEMDPTQWIETQPPVLRCFLAEPEAIRPLLLDALHSPESTPARRLLLSRLLLWHRDEAGVPSLLQAIEAMLAQHPGLPPREGPATFGQLLPDHGLMPEVVYLLNLLAWGHEVPVVGIFEKVLQRLVQAERDYTDLRAGIYCYVECFAYVAMRRGEAAFLPLLHALVALPELSGVEEKNPLLAERFAMLRLSLAEAMARLGDAKGHAMLAELTGYPALAVAESARMTLQGLLPAPAVQRVTRRMD